MTPISLSLPAGATAEGQLYSDYSACLGLLDQDVLQVTLANGTIIDVGWTNPFDLAGEFKIRVVRDDWDNPIHGPLSVKTTQQAVLIVNDLAKEYH